VLLGKRLADYMQTDIDSNIEKMLAEYVKNRKAECAKQNDRCEVGDSRSSCQY
jgi:trimethylamine:corrinoid methyltransferase-like protein